METAILYWGYIGTMEKKMETAIWVAAFAARLGVRSLAAYGCVQTRVHVRVRVCLGVASASAFGGQEVRDVSYAQFTLKPFSSELRNGSQT